MANRQHRGTSSERESRRSTGPWLGRSLVQPAVIGLFHRHGVLNGARLGEILGVGRSSAHLILDRLFRDGCLVMEGRRTGEPMPPGRPTTDYRLDPEHAAHLGAHVREDRVDWALAGFDGAIGATGTAEFGGLRRGGASLAAALSGIAASLLGEGWRRRVGHLGIAGLEEGAPAGIESRADELAARLDCPALRAIPAADAGAVAESIREPSRPEPTLYVLVQSDYTCPVGYASLGQGFTPLRRHAGMIDSVARRRDLWGAREPDLGQLPWGELATAARSGGVAAQMHSALGGELAEEVAKFASFLGASRVVVGSTDGALLESLLPVLRIGLPSRLVGIMKPTPDVAPPLRGPWGIAIGAALLPVASAIIRSFEFEALAAEASRQRRGSAPTVRTRP